MYYLLGLYTGFTQEKPNHPPNKPEAAQLFMAHSPGLEEARQHWPATNISTWECSHHPLARLGTLVRFPEVCLHHRDHSPMEECNRRGQWAQDTALHRAGSNKADGMHKWIRLKWDGDVLWLLPPLGHWKASVTEDGLCDRQLQQSLKQPADIDQARRTTSRSFKCFSFLWFELKMIRSYSHTILTYYSVKLFNKMEWWLIWSVVVWWRITQFGRALNWLMRSLLTQKLV